MRHTLTRISAILLALLLTLTSLVGCDLPDISDLIEDAVGDALGGITDSTDDTTGITPDEDEKPDYKPDEDDEPDDTTEEDKPEDKLPPVVDFYGDYLPARTHAEAVARSKQGLLSGLPTVPDQAPTKATYQPDRDGMLIHNTAAWYADANTYVVTDGWGREVFRVFRGGGYITLEEVAAYVYAFGDVPANYTSSKSAKPSSSIWGQYLRLNHSAFSGDTSRYPYEPELPRISGCGGDLRYYEIDIGTTGTDCDPSYLARPYNNGSSITRGAARIVYARYDRNGNQVIEANEKYVFYTYNHYNDFEEYLNYYGGWGKIFGNITGGGTISSKSHYNPTPYVVTLRVPLYSVEELPDDSITDAAAILLPLPYYPATKHPLAA